MKWPLRKITSKQILSQICPGDWFFLLYLKEAYFHIHISPHHRRFLRFAFEGVAYQYTVLPFGLSLAPRIFTQWMYVALSPLRQMRIRILNYLNDWLILALSEDEILSHRSVLLSHLGSIGQVHVHNLPGEKMAHGSRLHYGKKAVQQRQFYALGNVLLENIGSCHSHKCYFDTYHQLLMFWQISVYTTTIVLPIDTITETETWLLVAPTALHISEKSQHYKQVS